jgi:hypothetical protein
MARTCLKKKKLGLVAHVCNPIYWGGGDQEDHGWRLVPQQKISETPTNRLGVVMYAYDPSYLVDW